MNGEHPYGGHPSRTLFVRNINSNVEDSELRALFERHGEICILYTACKHRGFVMIFYYDIRAARTAMKALQSKPLRQRKLDIHYSIPKDNPTKKDINQGTLVVFNLDSSVSNEELHHIFGAYGEIKEVKISFVNLNRAAEAALHELNRSGIAGKQIKLEPSCPGGVRHFAQNNPLESEQEEFDLFVRRNSPANNSNAGLSGSVKPSSTDDGTIMGFQSSMHSSILESAFHPGVSSSVPNSLPSLMRAGSVGSHPGLADSGHSMGHLKFDIRPTQNGSCTLPGQYPWGNHSYQPQPSSMMWPNSPSFVNKKQYELDIDRIMRGEDNRTTLMIKNIPNKYPSKMLLAAIDECHRGTYDFIYLPIDFKKWEKFNSEKVASLANARIQGKAALIAHFRNSSLMNEDKRCRPILFNTEGPNAGDQVPFTMGVNVRTRPGKSRTGNPEDNDQGNRSSLPNGEDSSHGHVDTSTGCGKESD
ncbi:hypothetical protein CDL15_Pgr009927 [Punica granatum]|uniref:RRM domain-containing protein n=1 Tax=Punica granatum TaxID=22663 RepID=A0A218WVM3_PUNGR|nr:hypothetical protein CDL15_Pgr009927 [Punica granatum]